MNKIAIITDSDASLPADVAGEYGIRQVPITVQFGEEVFQTGIDIDDMRLFERIDRINKLPTTAAPPPGAFAAAYQSALDEGAEAVICICVSSKISATYSSALTAVDMFPGRDITVVDSLSVSMGQGFMAMESVEAVRRGASRDEILAHIESMKPRIHLYGALSTLKYLALSGRVGKLAAGFADTLSIKPLLELQDGKLELLEKIRTQKKSLERMLELTGQSLNGRPVQRAAVLHVCNLEGARALRDQLCSQLGCPSDMMICEFGAGLSVHTGAGMLGVAVLAQ
jgi:DegV family protein with EDD domain